MSRRSTGTASMDALLAVLDGFKGTMIISAACELQLFDELQGRPTPTSAQDVANSNGWNADATARLLDACVSYKMVVKSFNDNGDAVYGNAPAANYLLRHGMPSLWGYVHNMHRYISNLSNLATEVRTGGKKDSSFSQHGSVPKTSSVETPDSGSQSSGQGSGQSQGPHHGHGGNLSADELLLRYEFLDTMCRPHVDALVRMVDLSEHKTAVDLGAGSGVVTFALRRAYPEMKVILFDLVPIVQLVRDHFLTEENAPKVELMEGDFFVTALPTADLYVLSKVVHDFREDQIRTLLRRVHSTLNTGGALMLFEKCLDDRKDGPAPAHEWDMMVLSSCGGRIRSGREYTELLTSEGFCDVTIRKTQERCSYDVIYAKKT